MNYLTYLHEVKQRDEQTIQRNRLWLKHLLEWADSTDFNNASRIRPVFPAYLRITERRDNGETLSAVGIKRTCRTARAFFEWLLQQKQQRYAGLSEQWVDTLQPPRLQATPRQKREVVTMEIVQKLIAVKVGENDIASFRDKAAAAFLFLSGMRATAFVTMPIEALKLEERSVLQFPALGMKTKNLKAAKTHLLPIDNLLEIVSSWDAYVRNALPATAPWYAVVNINLGKQELTAEAAGEYRRVTLAKNLRALFKQAGLPPMSPHKFRHGHAIYGLEHARNLADWKAVSQNLMHSSIGVTDSIYSILSDDDLQLRISALGENNVIQNDNQHSLSDKQIEALAAAIALKLEGKGT